MRARYYGWLAALAVLMPFKGAHAGGRPRPPLCPRWALLPWVWDDRGRDGDFSAGDGNAHRSAAALDLVDGYRRRGIPVGAVILDSPWSSNYNTFRFDPRRYGDGGTLIKALHARGVRVVAWLTAAMNPGSGAFPDEADYQYAMERRYLLLAPGGGSISWWKGHGGLINYDDRRAVRWWHGLMDRALDLGIDGWKVDKVEASLPDEVDERGRQEPVRVSAYRRAYFRDTYQYLLRRRPEGVVIQRPFYRNTVAYTPAGWVGDQWHTWKGLRSAMRLVLGAARCGNAVVGSDIGGYLGGPPNKSLYLRWAQFGALCPLMETGGQGERRPWKIDDDAVQIFRRFAVLHTELVPYLYSQMVEAHETGQPIIRGGDLHRGEYLLGPELFVSVVMRPGLTKNVRLPAGDWIDFWDESRRYHGPALLRDYPAPLDRIPLFVRRGAILPLDVTSDLLGHGDGASTGALTLAAYPAVDGAARTTLATPGSAAAGDTLFTAPESSEDGSSNLTTAPSACRYRYETGPGAYASAALRVEVGSAGVTLSVPPLPQAVRVRVRLAARPAAVSCLAPPTTAAPVAVPELADRAAFEGAKVGWRWDAGLLWVKL